MKRIFIFLALFISFLIYSFVVYTTGTKQDQYANESAVRGKLLFQEHNCISCHQIYGLGGYLGADLTTVISAKGKGEQYARAFIKSGTDRMPDFKLGGNDIDNLIEYLKFIDNSAITYKTNTTEL